MNPSHSGAPQQILVIRHGEKPPATGKPAGINEDGEPHVHSLVVRGWERAGALVPFFCDPRDTALQSPERVYAPPAHGQDGDHGRPLETVTAVAAKLGVTIETRFVLDQETELVAAVLATSGVALVAWEHKRIARIANAILGDTVTAPQTWPDDRFDIVFVFDRVQSSGTYRFSQRPQMLLAGDRAEPIG